MKRTEASEWLDGRHIEQKPIAESKRLANEVIEYLTKCGYSPALKDDSKKEHFHIDIPRHKDDFWQSEEYKHCRSVLGEYYMEGDYGGDTYTLYVWREKKEQKPTTIEKLRSISTPAEENWLEIQKKWEKEDAQKPAEWSEEEKQKLNRIYEILGYAADDKGFLTSKRIIGDKEAIELQDFLKSLRPQSKIHYWTEEEIEPIIGDYLTGKEHYGGMLARLRCLKPKPQWCPSEEELVALKRVGSILRDYGHSELAKMVFMIEGKLANLPVLNKLIWKPSEEQMEALESAVKLYKDTHFEIHHKKIESLYEQLKQL